MRESFHLLSTYYKYESSGIESWSCLVVFESEARGFECEFWKIRTGVRPEFSSGLKYCVSAAWVAGLVAGMTFTLWLIDADLTRFELIPVHYQLVDVLAVYLPVSVCMFYIESYREA